MFGGMRDLAFFRCGMREIEEKGDRDAGIINCSRDAVWNSFCQRVREINCREARRRTLAGLKKLSGNGVSGLLFTGSTTKLL